MALPGGQIIISEYFIQTQNLSDEALAFVLAHEMSHSILEHERQVLTFARMLLPRDVPRDVSDVYTEMEFNRKLSKAIEPLMQQGEFEADELGLLLAAKAGYDPEQQLAFVAAESAKGADSKAMLDTHPSAHQRLEKLQERLALARRLTPQ
jgi:predicted Zn-dependent protease